MRTLIAFIVPAVVLLGGCYTPLALVEDDPQVVLDPQPVALSDPWPIIILETVFVAMPSPVVTPQPAAPPATRPIGVLRSGSSASDRTPVSSDVRTTGSSRGGR